MCDGCEGDVRGIRYKCKTCDDYDLCWQCKKRGLHSHHKMRRIERPLNKDTLADTLGVLHPGVMCDGCEGDVHGIRYRCKTCDDYDLCWQCKKRGLHSHHEMRRIERPLKTDTLAGTLGVLHPDVICDSCEGDVRGIRYKCKTCDNYDLCWQCKKRGLHSHHEMRRIERPLKTAYSESGLFHSDDTPTLSGLSARLHTSLSVSGSGDSGNRALHPNSGHCRGYRGSGNSSKLFGSDTLFQDEDSSSSELVLPETIDWKLGKKLGEGGFGEVFRVKDHKGTPLPYAAKSVSVANEEDVEACYKEVSTLAKLKHPYIIRFIGVKRHPTDVGSLLIITELADGSIDDKLHKGGRFSERLTWQYTKMVLGGLAYIHSQKVIHRDIKGANILLDGGVVKLADFGVSKIAELLGTDLTMNTYYAAGTLYFMSPELLLALARARSKYGFSTDIWSYGCTVIHMLTGAYPNAGLSESQMLERALNRKSPRWAPVQAISDDMQRFFDRCFVGDPSLRPSARQLLVEFFNQ